VTERIICSLSDLLTRFENVPGRYTWHQSYLENDATITEIEISRGLLNIAHGLQYLHTVKKKLHLNVSPESIVLTPTGQWKLCGFGFNVAMMNDDTRVPLPYFLNQQKSTSLVRLEPDLTFCGPEMSEGANHAAATGVMEATIRYGTPASDIFSLGLLVFEMYRYNLQIAAQGRTYTPLVLVHNNSLLEHANTILPLLEQLDHSSSATPYGLRQLLIGMLQPNPIARVSGLDLINNPFFHSGDLTVFKTMDDLLLKDIGAQASLLSSLPNQINHFNSRILANTILPVICASGVQNPVMWAYSLPVIAFISTKLTTAAFVRVVTPPIITGLAVSDVTDTIFAFVKHMELFLEKFDSSFFTAHVIPMLCHGIDKQGAVALQVATISVLVDDRVLQAIEQQNFINDLIPRVCREVCKNNDSDVKLRGLYLLKTTAQRFDRLFITKSIFPSLKHVIEKSSPGPVVITACVGVYHAMIPLVAVETLCVDVLPVLLPVLVDRTITRDQFELILNCILSMEQLILTARTTEMSLPPVTLTQGGGSTPKSHFFKEDSDKMKGLSTTLGLSNSSMLTPTITSPPPVPMTLPPSIPSSVPPSVPAFNPPAVPNVPPPIPVQAPIPPPVPMAAPPSLPFSSPPPPIPMSAPPAPVIPQSPPSIPQGPPSIPSSAPPSNGAMSTIASFFSPAPSPASSTEQYTPPPAPPPPFAPPPAAPAQDIDMDDFMSSFSKPAAAPLTSAPLFGAPNPTPAVVASASVPKRASYSDKPNAPKRAGGIPPPKSAQTSAATARPPISGMEDLFGNLTIASTSSPANGTPPQQQLEDQYRKNQEEIQRLNQQYQQPSSSFPSSAPSSYSSPQMGMNYPMPGGGVGTNAMYGSAPQSVGAGGGAGMGMYGGGVQQPYGGGMSYGSPAPMSPNMTAPYGSQPAYGVGGGGVYGSPAQPLPGQPYSYPPSNVGGGMGGQPGQQYPPQANYGGYVGGGGGYSSAPYGGAAQPSSSNTGGSTGYRPPVIPPPGSGGSSGAKKSDPFDFLS
jgi:hypothetical protein